MKKEVYEFISKQSGESILEWKVCKWCGSDFAIFEGDKEMLDKLSPTIGGEKFQLPFPTLCPECRERRRIMFRNERNIYHRKCALTGIKTISTMPTQSDNIVYGIESYYGDKWSPLNNGRDFDFDKTLTEQLIDLRKVSPVPAVDHGRNNQNSDYTQHTEDLKNGYLCFACVGGEDMIHCSRSSKSNNSIDSTYMTLSDRIYDSTDVYNSNNIFGSTEIVDSSFIYFSYNVQGSNDVIFSSNIINGSYIIYNKKVSKEEFDAFLIELKKKMKTYSGYQEAIQTFRTIKKNTIHRAVDITNGEDVIGNSVVNSKDVLLGFECNNLENCRYMGYAKFGKNIMDAFSVYPEAEKCYEVLAAGIGSYNAYCSFLPRGGHDIYHSVGGYPINYSFAGVYNRNMDYTILNKKYEAKEWEIMVKKIIKHIQTTKERGEYPDPQLSSYPYNDSLAMEHYTINKVSNMQGGRILKEEIIDPKGKGNVIVLQPEKFISDAILDLGGEEKVKIKWKTAEQEINIPEEIQTIKAENLPESIDDVNDSILDKAIICEESGRPFRIIKQELEFYRKYAIPIPRKHYDVRHKDRLDLKPPRKLFLRNCDNCNQETLSVYPQDSEFKVYCEACYNKEIYG